MTERTVPDVIRELQEPAGQFGKSMVLCAEAAELLAVTNTGYEKVCEANNDLQHLIVAERKRTGETYVYACRLATSIWDKHFKVSAPDWNPLPDLLGLLTQIDNMTCELYERGYRHGLEVAASETDCGGPGVCRETRLNDGTCIHSISKDCPHDEAGYFRSLAKG